MIKDIKEAKKLLLEFYQDKYYLEQAIDTGNIVFAIRNITYKNLEHNFIDNAISFIDYNSFNNSYGLSTLDSLIKDKGFAMNVFFSDIVFASIIIRNEKLLKQAVEELKKEL